MAKQTKMENSAATVGTPAAKSDLATHARLMEAAGEIFAAKGFHAATVREICTKAGANVAAVNYHFKDKQALYSAVFQHAMGEVQPLFKKGPPVAGTTDPHVRLEAFVHGFMNNLLASGKPAWANRIMSMEMIEPTQALDHFVEAMIRPMFGALRSIVADALGRKADEDDVRYIGACIVGQCLFWKHSEPVIRRLYKDLTYTPEQIEHIAQHIAAFSWAALEGLRKQRVDDGKRKGLA